jgi:hypothetical protein
VDARPNCACMTLQHTHTHTCIHRECVSILDVLTECSWYGAWGSSRLRITSGPRGNLSQNHIPLRRHTHTHTHTQEIEIERVRRNYAGITCVVCSLEISTAKLNLILSCRRYTHDASVAILTMYDDAHRLSPYCRRDLSQSATRSTISTYH